MKNRSGFVVLITLIAIGLAACVKNIRPAFDLDPEQPLELFVLSFLTSLEKSDAGLFMKRHLPSDSDLMGWVEASQVDSAHKAAFVTLLTDKNEEGLTGYDLKVRNRMWDAWKNASKETGDTDIDWTKVTVDTLIIEDNKKGFMGVKRLMVVFHADSNFFSARFRGLVFIDDRWGILDRFKFGRMELSDALSLADESVLRTMIKSGKDLKTAKTANGTPLLVKAARMNKIEVAKTLLDAGVDINAGSQYFGTPLAVAIEDSVMSILEMLIGRGADVNHPARHGEYPLHLAAESGNVAAAELLIAAGAKVNIETDGSGKSTPMHAAASGGHAEVIKLLAKHGGDVNRATEPYNRTPLYLSVWREDTLALKVLIDLGADPDAANENDHRRTALNHAASQARLANVRVLLNAGADPNGKVDPKSNTPLMDAVLAKHMGIAWMLLEHGADVNGTGGFDQQTALHFAAGRRSDLEMVKLLFVKNADATIASASGATPLHEAARSDNVDIAKMLIAKGTDVNAVEQNWGYTALHMALSAYNHFDFAAMLIEQGAEVNIVDDSGNTALDYALAKSDTPIVEKLKAAGAKTGGELLK